MDILSDIETRRRPVADALKDWGVSHRFAGSGDRSAIGNLVHDALRRRKSLAAAMGDDSPRATVLAVYAQLWGKGLDGLVAALSDPHAPDMLSDAERKALAQLCRLPSPAGAPQEDASDTPGHDTDLPPDVPDWLLPSFARVFGGRVGAEAAALSTRAPVDLRVNRLKADREEILPAFAPIGGRATALAPHGIRIPVGTGQARAPHIESDPEYLKGLVEIQDEGSQLAALVAGAKAGEQVLDLCAGGGGKTLALAAEMQNKGQIFAYDSDKRRLRDLYARAERAGLRNLQILPPDRGAPLDQLADSIDLVLIDAPCSGTGTWRRRPDTKWRLTEKSLAARMAEQDAVLAAGYRFLRPKGRIVYITCSVLAEENEDRIAAFLHAHPDMTVTDPLARLDADLAARLKPFVRSDLAGLPVLRLTPAGAGTDGFFVATLGRSAS